MTTTPMQPNRHRSSAADRDDRPTGLPRVPGRGQLLSAGDVVEATSISYSQLLYWTKKGMITAQVESTGSGSWYRYSPDVVEQIEDMVSRINLCPYNHTSHRTR